MLMYILLFCITITPSLFLDVNKSDVSKKKYLIMVFGIMAFLSSFRSVFVGKDTIQFTNAYIRIGNMTWKQASGLRYEPAFILMCKLLNYVKRDYRILLIVTSCIIAFSFAWFIYKNSDDVVFSTIIYLLFMFPNSMNTMRQYIAICLLFLGLEFIKRKKIIVFLIFLFIAISFHYSAVIGIVYLLIYNLKSLKSLLLIIALPTAIILNIYYRLLLTLSLNLPLLRIFQIYIGSKYDEQVNNGILGMLFPIFIFVLYAFNIKKSNNINNNRINNNFIFNMLLIWVLWAALSNNMVILTRIIPYFSFIAIISIPKAISNINNKLLKSISTIMICAIFVAYFYYGEIYRIWSGAVPYKFY